MKVTEIQPAREVEGSEGSLYRWAWRWHFFAGLICLPVLAIMAFTGALYLFREEISDVVYPSRLLPPASQERAALPLGTVIERVLTIVPGVVHQIELPQDERRSLAVILTPQGGMRSVLHVDPTDASVLALYEETWQWDVVAKDLHSGSLLGRWANIAVEVIAGWCIVLIASGTYLWWPRGKKRDAFTMRGSPGGRLWWRDLHAVTGALTGLLVLFLAVTGMPWTELWGQQFSALSKRFGLGHPVHVWEAVPQSTVPMSKQGEVPWTFSHATIPASATPQAQAGHEMHGASSETSRQAQWGFTPAAIGMERAVEIFADLGLKSGYTLRLPFGEEGAYTALRFPQQIAGQRVIHLDQYSGDVLIDVGFSDYGVVAKGVEWGIGVHKGQEYGLVNRLAMLAGCLAVLLLALSSVQMWWKRRPKGRLAAPPRKQNDRLARGAVVIALALGILFPPLGASMLAAAALEWLWSRCTAS